ncbi:MAG TPA: shikimate dehydrogenase [Candidatus Angelobacter sp.]|nr:shikimate dehydrogenase [Candidatus Angelobacter sp.]
MPVAVVTQLWLLGHGVQGSPSPAMQNAALRARALPWTYSIRDVPADGLDGALAELRSGAAAGCNVTIPHKRAVAAACDSLEGDAALTGAVNTVVVRDGLLIGHNTDAEGFRLALVEQGLTPAPGSSVVVLGAGGAARAVMLAMQRCGVGSIAVMSRRRQEDIAQGSLPWDHQALRDHLSTAGPTHLVNATPVGLGDLPLDVDELPDSCTVIDLRYRYTPTDLIPTARTRGLSAADGREMLLQQGMLSFQLWTGEHPPYAAARQALDAAI